MPWQNFVLMTDAGLAVRAGHVAAGTARRGRARLRRHRAARAAAHRRVCAALSARQTAYEDAPQTHQVKTGTPTMGGLLFGIAPLVALLLVPSRSTFALAVLVYACMAIGAYRRHLEDPPREEQRACERRRKIRADRRRGGRVLVRCRPAADDLSRHRRPCRIGCGTGSRFASCSPPRTRVNLTDGLDGLAGRHASSRPCWCSRARRATRCR